MIIKVGIVDDHTLFRKSLKLLISNFENIEVKLEASNGIELLDKIDSVDLDVLLLDIQMPKMNGIEACKILNRKKPDLKILILTHLESVVTISQVINLGIKGYFTKNTEPNELKSVILNLNDDGFYFEKSLQPILDFIKQEDVSGKKNYGAYSFTEREIEVLNLTIQQFSGNMIADKLFISLKTVEKHKRNLMAKTSSKNFIGVIVYALVNNFISLDQVQ